MKQNLFNLFSKRLFILIGFLSVGLHVNAETEAKNTLSRYVVEVDSQFIKATPYEITYENNEEIHHDENVEWYNDMTVYRFLPKEIDENGAMSKTSSPKTSIFLLSGGGFVSLDNQTELNPSNNNLHSNIKLASKLANDGYNVFWIDYQLETNGANKNKIDSLFKKPQGACYLGGTEAKARMEHASLKSFRDFRVKFKSILENSSNDIDTNNIFISGISAGAFLTIYSVFLDQNEIPSSISYVDCGGGTTTIVSIDANHNLRKDGYPIPTIKGIIPMAGGSFYDNIFNNTAHSNNVAVNFMHGTCDEVINQEEGRVSYKFLKLKNLIPLKLEAEYNDKIVDRYPYVYGSKYLYNLLKSTHNKIGFGQVIRGGHSVITLKSIAESDVGAWDALDVLGYKNPPHNPNMTLPINQRDIVYDNISMFIKRVQGISGLAWDNHAYSLFSDIPTTMCLTDDQALINPPISISDTVCVNLNSTATLIDAPSWITKTWTVSSNLQIVGSNTGDSITYKGLNLGIGTITVTIDNYGSGPVVISKTVMITPNMPIPTPTPTSSSDGYDFFCASSGSKTLTLTNLPLIYSSIVWTSSGSIEILSQSDSSVTYKKSTGISPGILTVTIKTSCQTKSFNFPITYYSNLNGSYLSTMGMSGPCGGTIFYPGEVAKLIPNSNVTFTIIYPSAILSGMTGVEWDFACGTIINGPNNYWVGNDFKSQIDVKVSNNPYSNCSFVKARPINPCSVGPWRVQNTQFGTCGGGWSLLVYPNPSSNNLVLTLDNTDEKLITQQYPIEIVDVRGNTVMRSVINNGKSQLEIGHLLSGHYKIIVRTDNEIITESFIIKK